MFVYLVNKYNLSISSWIWDSYDMNEIMEIVWQFVENCVDIRSCGFENLLGVFLTGFKELFF